MLWSTYWHLHFKIKKLTSIFFVLVCSIVTLNMPAQMLGFQVFLISVLSDLSAEPEVSPTWSSRGRPMSRPVSGPGTSASPAGHAAPPACRRRSCSKPWTCTAGSWSGTGTGVYLKLQHCQLNICSAALYWQQMWHNSDSKFSGIAEQRQMNDGGSSIDTAVPL